MPAQLGGAPCCPRCNERVYFNEAKNFMSRSWHKKCFLCDECGKLLESANANQDDDNGSVHCNTCFRRLTAPAPEATTSPAYVNHDDVDCCPRCGTKVYFAEQMLTLGRKWHKQCFSCGECKKRLDPVSIADHKGEVFCKPCYGRLFGPKGYGYAGGAGNGLSMDAGVNSEDINNVPHTAKAYLAPTEDGKKADSERALEAGAELCPRCGMQVFIAEKKAAAGKAYHDRCFRCDSCEKKLDLGALSENMGKIYCKTCYGKNFGPKGYGYGVGGGTLQAQ